MDAIWKPAWEKKVLRKRWDKDFLPIFLMKKSQKSWKEGQKCISLIYFFLNSCFDKHTIELLYKFSFVFPYFLSMLFSLKLSETEHNVVDTLDLLRLAIENYWTEPPSCA